MFSVQKKRKFGLFPMRWHASAPLCMAAGASCWATLYDGVTFGERTFLLAGHQDFLGTGVGCEMVAEILAAENEATR